MGAGSLANGGSATATGSNSTANGSLATALGEAATANGASATAIGQFSVANGATATALGQGSLANATAATAVGQGATVAFGATGGTALGQGATVTAAGGTALGTGASAGFAGSTAIGAGATITAVNQMMFGTATNTYAAPGITSPASLAAQSGTTNFVTTDSAGHLATSAFGPSTIASLNASVASLQSQVIEVRRGVAAALATNGYMMPSGPGKLTLQFSGGSFHGESAGAATFAYRLNTAAPAVLFGSVANGGGNEWAGKVGFGMELTASGISGWRFWCSRRRSSRAYLAYALRS
jgi:hypothetical protein